MEKLNNLLSFNDFDKSFKPREQRKTKRTEVGLDILNENFFYKLKNKRWMDMIDTALLSDDVDQMIDCLEEIAPHTYFSDRALGVAKLDEMRLRVDEDPGYARNVKGFLKSFKLNLQRYPISRIRFYGPNHGLAHWMFSDSNASFSL